MTAGRIGPVGSFSVARCRCRWSARADPHAHGYRRQQVITPSVGPCRPIFGAQSPMHSMSAPRSANLKHPISSMHSTKIRHLESAIHPAHSAAHPGPGAFGEVMQFQQADGPASGSMVPESTGSTCQLPSGRRGVSGRGTPRRRLRQRQEDEASSHEESHSKIAYSRPKVTRKRSTGISSAVRTKRMLSCPTPTT